MKTQNNQTSALAARQQEEALQGYLFHYNPYTKFWAAFPRECMNDYFNGVDNSKIVKNKNPQTLIKFLIKESHNN